jgi:hypothetical protein
MLKFRSDSCLSKQNKSAYTFKINIGQGHENAWRIWSSLNEHMRWWYIHKIQNQCIGFLFKAKCFNYERLTSFTHAQIFCFDLTILIFK